jgi:hypothetical protein
MSLGQMLSILCQLVLFSEHAWWTGTPSPLSPPTPPDNSGYYANFVVVNQVEGLKPALGLRITRLHVSNLPKAASPVDHRFPVLLIRR